MYTGPFDGPELGLIGYDWFGQIACNYFELCVLTHDGAVYHTGIGLN